MAVWLEQSQTATVKLGPFLDEDDGKTAETGLTISQADVVVSKNGGAFAQKNEASASTHDAAGWYDVDLDATDTGTVGRLVVSVHESGALPVWREFMVVPSNTYDSIVGGTDKLEVDAVAISGDTTAADNLEVDYDGTGYAKANSTIGTCTANTDMRGTDSAALASVCTEARLAELDAANLPTDVAACATTTELNKVPKSDGSTTWNATALGSINSQVSDVLKTDTISQLAQQLPPSTPTFEQAVMYLYQYMRNKRTQTASAVNMFAEDESTVIATAALSDTGSIFTKGEFAAGS